MNDLLLSNASVPMQQAAQRDVAQDVKALNDHVSPDLDMDAIEAVARDFEAVFVSEMMKPMFANLEAEAPFNGGRGEDVFRGMLLQEYGDIISKTGSIGVADHVKNAVIQIQEEANGTHAKRIAEHKGVIAHDVYTAAQ